MLYLARTLGHASGHVHLGLIKSFRAPNGLEQVFINGMPPMEDKGGRAWIEEIMQEHADMEGEGMKVHVWAVSGCDDFRDIEFKILMWSH